MPLSNITEESLEIILDRKLKPLSDKMEELVKAMEIVSAKYDELLKKQNNLETANDQLQKENIKLLLNQVFYLQNNAAQMSNNLNDLSSGHVIWPLWMPWIRSLPVKKVKNTDDLVRLVGDLINVSI